MTVTLLGGRWRHWCGCNIVTFSLILATEGASEPLFDVDWGYISPLFKRLQELYSSEQQYRIFVFDME